MAVAGDAMFGMEDASTKEEAPMPAVTLDSENRPKLLDLPNPKVTTVRVSA